ncbi:hypothetical protein GUJ93_ZPchr0005g14678 [Zizania palustris]|uniref:Uncharacterized protein n=1 Tax=Zizania palustris TaxID=103762 RepID=A0A8J5SXL2_ZIZPA|nr:hypothetical protein GUJ93_ZPchr0005g14678 [Zizania palustris]
MEDDDAAVPTTSSIALEVSELAPTSPTKDNGIFDGPYDVLALSTALAKALVDLRLVEASTVDPFDLFA